ncbi:MAG: hypothetical protein LAP38_02755 [Acidobacteriia bacterium]|nr:hypothetical protein [Terriglobia bacterium]
MTADVLLFRISLGAAFLLLAAFAAVIAGKMWRGDILLDGLLDSKDATGERSFSPARLQLLIITLAVAADYVHQVWISPQRSSLPSLSKEVIAALGGSQAIYLGAKWYALLIEPFLRNLTRR